jgi:hypothetical protein
MRFMKGLLEERETIAKVLLELFKAMQPRAVHDTRVQVVVSLKCARLLLR